MGCYLNATEPKPVCTECGRVYSSVSNLKQHIANVHSATPHWEPCPVCGKHFKTRQYLFNHLLQTHGIRQRGSRMHMHLPAGGGSVGGGGVGGGGGHHHHHNHHHHQHPPHPSHPSTVASSSSPLQAHSPSATISSCFSNTSVVKPLISHHADIKPLSHASVAAATAAAASAAATAAADHNEQRQQQQQQQHPPNSFVPPLPSSSSVSVLNRLHNPDLSSQFYMLSKSAVTR
ncbi:broad-complex core protein isoforms 1/2/3/4/5-like isoform X3 [Aphis craccivora]|uniref:Broad-complex core protein isoforms 1/2/3/4/5-like isoform X3 n=1 Tax=Aphis craccivora TaxID=307492 RepID=A0A6G0YWM9_APHCR|nr:broad-complex core protein isoforms 1/2/3/4/5-like isoform X3 [Aphis craccivora]